MYGTWADGSLQSLHAWLATILSFALYLYHSGEHQDFKKKITLFFVKIKKGQKQYGR